MKTRKLGSTGLDLTELSFGAAPIGNLYRPVERAQAMATLQAAWDGGIRYFDTAPFYGQGLSERRVGDFLQDKPRDSFVLSTKVGRLLEPVTSGPLPDTGYVGALPFSITGSCAAGKTACSVWVCPRSTFFMCMIWSPTVLTPKAMPRIWTASAAAASGRWRS